jgi:hypothetical protein
LLIFCTKHLSSRLFDAFWFDWSSPACFPLVLLQYLFSCIHSRTELCFGFFVFESLQWNKMEMTVEVSFWQKLLCHKRHCDEKRCKLLLNFTFNSRMRSILYCALEANIFSSRRYFHLFHPKRLFHLFSFSVFQLLNF